jgi:hypothetical protein
VCARPSRPSPFSRLQFIALDRMRQSSRNAMHGASIVIKRVGNEKTTEMRAARFGLTRQIETRELPLNRCSGLDARRGIADCGISEFSASVEFCRVLSSSVEFYRVPSIQPVEHSHFLGNLRRSPLERHFRSSFR